MPRAKKTPATPVQEEERLTPEAPVESSEEKLEPSQPAQEEKVEPKEERLQPAPAPEFAVQPVDYLRKFQYRKQTEFGSVASDPQAGSKAEKMKLELLSQPKVGFVIPLGLNEDPKARHSVCLNGYRLDFPKNTAIDIPQQISQMLMDSHGLTTAAISQFQIARKDQEAALI